jgi:hypothetical protein
MDFMKFFHTGVNGDLGKAEALMLDEAIRVYPDTNLIE